MPLVGMETAIVTATDATSGSALGGKRRNRLSLRTREARCQRSEERMPELAPELGVPKVQRQQRLPRQREERTLQPIPGWF